MADRTHCPKQAVRDLAARLQLAALKAIAAKDVRAKGSDEADVLRPRPFSQRKVSAAAMCTGVAERGTLVEAHSGAQNRLPRCL